MADICSLCKKSSNAELQCKHNYCQKCMEFMIENHIPCVKCGKIYRTKAFVSYKCGGKTYYSQKYDEHRATCKKPDCAQKPKIQSEQQAIIITQQKCQCGSESTPMCASCMQTCILREMLSRIEILSDLPLGSTTRPHQICLHLLHKYLYTPRRLYIPHLSHHEMMRRSIFICLHI
jgi:hypothetical protein